MLVFSTILVAKFHVSTFLKKQYPIKKWNWYISITNMVHLVMIILEICIEFSTSRWCLSWFYAIIHCLFTKESMCMKTFPKLMESFWITQELRLLHCQNWTIWVLTQSFHWCRWLPLQLCWFTFSNSRPIVYVNVLKISCRLEIHNFSSILLKPF